MKKFIALMLLGAFVVSAAIGCGEKKETEEKKPEKPATTDPE